MKPIRLSAAAATTLALTALLVPAMNAYTTYGKWGTLFVSFYVNPANADVSNSAAISALQGGMETWNTQSGTSFRFGYAGQVSAATTGYDGKNVILFRSDSNGSTIASTYAWSSGGVLVDSDIVFWDGGFKFFTGSGGCSSGAYIEDIAAHELGHAMGLLHSSSTDATMYARYSTCSQQMRTLSADDVAGARMLYSGGAGVLDTPPTVRILAPASGASVTEGTAVTFSGAATDTTDGDISGRLSWRSSTAGAIGTGATFSRALPAGSHTITATVTDSIGYTTNTAITLSVLAASTNTAPTVTIISPTNGATVSEGASVTFSGSANDKEDGNLTTRLAWRSSVEGNIGTGGTFTRQMRAGTHTITAAVTDGGGLTTHTNVTLYVTASLSTGATLTARGYKEKGLQKVDLAWKGLTATKVDVYRNSAKITSTANDGATTDPINTKGGGKYTYKICAAGTTTCSNVVTVTF
jgi:hypothetical protein